MTTEEKTMRLKAHCDGIICCLECPLFNKQVDCKYTPHGFEIPPRDVDRAYDILFPTTTEEPRIKDSGERRQFDTGCVRDIADGKGRCDLLPLDVLAEYIDYCGEDDRVLFHISQYIYSGNKKHIYDAIAHFQNCRGWGAVDMMVEVSKHYEEGARKYAERNWEKGMPLHCYIDSGVRHYIKYMRGDQDEPHCRAFIWNMLGALWTQKHKPELIDLPFVQNNKKSEE